MASIQEVTVLTTDGSLGGAARLYARLGFAVFPCHVRGDSPAIADWRSQATRDPDQIDRWWSENPHYNVAVMTNGMRVVEVHRKHCSRLSEEMLLRSDCPVSGPLKGHLRFWFRTSEVDDDFDAVIGRLQPDVRVYGDGDFVLVPPSFVGGQNFEMN